LTGTAERPRRTWDEAGVVIPNDELQAARQLELLLAAAATVDRWWTEPSG
jgi:hypothetical protein